MALKNSCGENRAFLNTYLRLMSVEVVHSLSYVARHGEVRGVVKGITSVRARTDLIKYLSFTHTRVCVNRAH